MKTDWGEVAGFLATAAVTIVLILVYGGVL